MSKKLSALAAAHAVLKQAGQPLHNREITRRILDQELWKTTGKTPAYTLNARISVDIKKKGEKSRFQRTKKGVYALREWGLSEFHSKQRNNTVVVEVDKSATTLEQMLTFADAAEKVLREHADEQPAHCQVIVDKMVELELLSTRGKLPNATLNAIIGREIEQAKQQGDIPRFFRRGTDSYGLTAWMDEALTHHIGQHNRKIRAQLLAQLQTMAWEAFEHVIGRLLIALGFENVTATPASEVGHMDVRGTLVIGTVIRTRMAVQIVRLDGKNIRKSIVERLRESLGTHEQGLIITTNDFSDGAKVEAGRADVAPIALMSGAALARVLIANDIGTERNTYSLIDLAAE